MNYVEFLGRIDLAGVDHRDGKLYVEWTTGGHRGGNCWGDDYGPYEPEPDFVDLEKALLATCPHLGWLQFKALERELVQHGSRNEDNYYGQHHNLAYKQLYLIELHAWLQERALLS